MSPTQTEKGERFLALHQGPGTFVIANPWDIGSAKILEGVGFPALATSSAASAMTMGKKDGTLSREQALEHAREIAGATAVPVSADLENGFGDAPETVAETVRLAGEAGLAGCTIEDSTGSAERPVYDLEFAAARIAAGVKAARRLGFPFLLTARAHNLLYANPSVSETIRRLQAYERAGADVLFAPGLPDLTAVRAVCGALSKPFNFMAGLKGKSFSVKELSEAGVRRISLATSLYRVAMTGLLDAAREVMDVGSFEFVERGVPTVELLKLMKI